MAASKILLIEIFFLKPTDVATPLMSWALTRNSLYLPSGNQACASIIVCRRKKERAFLERGLEGTLTLQKSLALGPLILLTLLISYFQHKINFVNTYVVEHIELSFGARVPEDFILI